MISDDNTGRGANSLDLRRGPLLGRVARVDPRRVEVEVSGDLVARIAVSNLVAMPAGSGFLVGLVDTISARGAGDVQSAIGAQAGTVTADLRVMPIGSFVAEHGGTPALRRGASAYPHIGAGCHLIDGALLGALMSIVADEVGAGERLVLGHYLSEGESPAVADGNHLFQRHLALLGSTGVGKSWAVALMLERASALAHANLIVFDLHGEYGPLCQPGTGRAPVARGLRVAGPADLGRSDDHVLYLPYWLLERDELLALTLNPTDPYAPDQVVRFTQHMQTLKGVYLVQVGREEAVATFTVDSPIPYSLGHLAQMLRRDDTEQIPQPPSHRLAPGPHYGRLTGFISRIAARMDDPRYGFIFTPPDHTLAYEWLADMARILLGAARGEPGIKVIDLSEVPSSIVPIVVGVLARLVYDVQFWIDPDQRTPVCLVCDEAHLYLPQGDNPGRLHTAALHAFESIAKEGRKYGVGLFVVSQRPTDDNRTILSQCKNFIVMRITNDSDQAMIKHLVPETISGVVDLLPVLDVGEAVVIGDALRLPTRILFDTPTIRPASTTKPYWSLWATQPSNPEAIVAGVEAMRNQLRGRRAVQP
ncbi:MAG: ATP-binding protein [Solirubrobacteraceae bacterium]